jgi:hypothetical protein
VLSGTGDDARLQAAPEDDRELDLVEHDHRRARLGRDAVAAVEIGHAARFGGELAVADAAPARPALHEGRLVALPLSGVAVDEMGRGIAVRWGSTHPPDEACPCSRAPVLLPARDAISCIRCAGVGKR